MIRTRRAALARKARGGFPKKSCSNKKLEHEAGELIERVGELQAHDNKGRDH
jgi:hypothetical protein